MSGPAYEIGHSAIFLARELDEYDNTTAAITGQLAGAYKASGSMPHQEAMSSFQDGDIPLERLSFQSGCTNPLSTLDSSIRSEKHPAPKATNTAVFNTKNQINLSKKRQILYY